MKHRFVDGPVLIVPKPHAAAFITTDMTPIPSAGTVHSSYRAADAEWGSLEAGKVLVWADQDRLSLPGQWKTDGRILRGDNWTLELAPGWTVKPGNRSGDFEVGREVNKPPP